MDNGLSLADAMALKSGDDGMFGGNGIMALILILVLFGGAGFGGFGRGAAAADTLSQAEMQSGFNTQNILRGIESLTAGTANAAYENIRIADGINQNVLVGNSNLSTQMCEGLHSATLFNANGFNSINTNNQNNFNAVNNSINNLSHDMQMCCCTTQRSIDSLKFENAQNTTAITNAIHCEGEQTRALINANTMQDLRDRLSTAEGAISNAAQSQYILGQLGTYRTNPPCPLTCMCPGSV